MRTQIVRELFADAHPPPAAIFPATDDAVQPRLDALTRHRRGGTVTHRSSCPTPACVDLPRLIDRRSPRGKLRPDAWCAGTQAGNPGYVRAIDAAAVLAEAVARQLVDPAGVLPAFPRLRQTVAPTAGPGRRCSR